MARSEIPTPSRRGSGCPTGPSARRNRARAPGSQARPAYRPARRGSSALRKAAGKRTARAAARFPDRGSWEDASGRYYNRASSMIRSDIDWDGLRGAFAEAQPFPHVVIDDFFEPGVPQALERDIPAFEDPSWVHYSDPVELQ